VNTSVSQLFRVEEREGLGGQYLELGSGGSTSSNYAHQQAASQLRVQQIHQVTTQRDGEYTGCGQ
jgi:hypothetical protein